MNPLIKFRDYFIGSALAKTDDVFVKARIELLFSFSMFFLLIGIIFSVLSAQKSAFPFILSIMGVVFLVGTLIVLKRTGNVRWAASIYIINHAIQNILHWLYGNGNLDMQSICWLLLFSVFGFLVMGRKWGFAMSLLIWGIILFTIADENSGFKYYQFPGLLVEDTANQYAVIIPILLITYLISQFVRAQQKAEVHIKQQKLQTDSTNRELESKNKDITDSINYARRIQHAVLPQEEFIYRNVPLSFIYYKPRDIVSGDFFWFHNLGNDGYLLACGDCTGHGVPGALMTVIGSNLLNQTVIDNKITEPSQILLVLDNLINITLKQQKEHEHSVQDGMDLALLKVDKAKREFTFASAKRPAIFIRDKQLQELKGSKHTLGGMITGCKTFQETKMSYKEDDIIYFFTDGITDQFGGADNKKFTIKRFREVLLDIHRLPIKEQRQKTDNIVSAWIGKNEQTDDITLMGIRF